MKGRKVVRLADDDKAIYLQKRAQDMPVSGPILYEKATQLYTMLHDGD